MAEQDLIGLNLDVYDTQRGQWNPEHGDISIPDEWEFLPSGDAFVTRTVTATGVYWVAWRPRGKGRNHRRRLGLWAPSEAIARARAAAEETAAKRASARDRGERQRTRAEDRYREELAAAIVDYLAFRPAHQELADRIGKDAAERAATVSSGRVGRTRALPVEERADLAARAWIRHRFTDYEDQLGAEYGETGTVDELGYRAIKRAANEAVDDFLATHRG